MDKLIDLTIYPISKILPILLKDKTTKNNIIWATNSYEQYGKEYTEKNEITISSLQKLEETVFQPRVFKSKEKQTERTKKHAEVFTPLWICNMMNNFCDDEWFDKKNVFNTQYQDTTWKAKRGRIGFSLNKTWKDYIYSRKIEITCGEAPYIVSRYDTTTGEIIKISKRIGILDRKLRVVNENTSTESEWFEWTKKAYQSTYGYEFQGDNLLIARINLLLTFIDYFKHKWNKEPDIKYVRIIANIIVWNIWQMDGFTYRVPFNNMYFSKIKNWRDSGGKVLYFKDLRKEK